MSARKSKRININYKPLQTSCDIEVVGSVPGKQIYQADLGEWTPDYTLTPLTLFPRCNATDPQAVKKIGVVNASLTNMVWYERVDGVRRLIESTNAEYSIVYEGSNKGQIQVRKNVQPLHPVTLEFEAEYADARTGQVFKFRMSCLVSCTDGTAALPVLTIDSPSTYDWNPVREKTSQQTVTARVTVGGEDVTLTDKCRLFWYVKDTVTGTLTQLTGTGEEEWQSVSLTKHQYTLDRDFMGDEMVIVVKCTYDADGHPAAAPDVWDEVATTVIRRRIPKLECDWCGVPSGVADGTAYLYPEPIVTDSKGVIDVPEEMFRFYWNVKKPTDAGFTRVADCKNPRIPFTDGMLLELEVADRGAYVLLTQDGALVTKDGVPVYVRKNG